MFEVKLPFLADEPKLMVFLESLLLLTLSTPNMSFILNVSTTKNTHHVVLQLQWKYVRNERYRCVC